MPVYHTTTIGERDVSWQVDHTAAGSIAGWAARSPATLTADLEGMAAYFPHWLLAGTSSGRLVRCNDCAAPVVPTTGAIRCPGCGQIHHTDGLGWFGHLPTLARPEVAFTRKRAALCNAGFTEIETGGAVYLLVPLGVHYPHEWPNVEPAVRYSVRWLDALGLPRASAGHHLVGVGQACIFSWGQWSAMPVHAVLQQRMVNHLVSLLKIAAGQSPQQAFIGRIHNDQWQPER